MQDLACPVSRHVAASLVENQWHDPSSIAKETSDVGRHWRLPLGLFIFLSDPGVPGVRSMGPDVRPSLRTTLCADLTDVTLADEDSNSIPTDDVNGQSQAMHYGAAAMGLWY